LSGYLETGNKKRKSVAADAGAGVEAGCWWDGGQVSQTLDAVLAKGQTMPEKNRFPAVLTPVVIDLGDTRTTHAVVQPIPIQDGREIEKHQNGMGVGNSGDPAYTIDTTGAQAAAIPFRKSKRACSTTDNETWVPADASNTLNNFDLGDTRTTHAVVQPHIVQASELRLRGQITEKDVCPTLTAGAKQGDTDPLAVHPICSDITGTLTVGHHSCAGHQHRMGDHSFLIGEAITFQPGNLRREAGADPSFTTTTTLKASAGDQTPHVATPMAVRRLTPIECERLQGFPDNWSRISWKGKPETECPDGPRYKACGNSMAVPVMRWIGERIADVDSIIFPNA
jgi:DNA (cytosine-5)-methyltransferase 1